MNATIHEIAQSVDRTDNILGVHGIVHRTALA